MILNFSDFEKIDMRVGKIISIEPLLGTHKSFYKLIIDFGDDIGLRTSCAQATHYQKELLIDREIICIVNLLPKKIASDYSEVLVLGVPTKKDGIALLMPDKEAILGSRVF